MDRYIRLTFFVALLLLSPSDSAAADVPDWVTNNRVHGHVILGKKWADRAAFKSAGGFFSEMGVEVYTRHVKSSTEKPVWMGSEGLSSLVRDAEKNDLKLFGYYWHMGDKEAALAHPEWVCKNYNGSTATKRNRGVYMDLSSPYREVVLDDLRQLAAAGLRGFYFDHIHMPRFGCWGTALEKSFARHVEKKEKQMDWGIVKNLLGAKSENQEEFVRYQAHKVVETFAYWKRKLKAEYPDILFIISGGRLPLMTDSHLISKLLIHADLPKGEFHTALHSRQDKGVFSGIGALLRPGDVQRMTMGWLWLRGAAGGRPPHIWSPVLATANDDMAFSHSVMSMGGIANLHIPEGIIEKYSKVSRVPERYKKVARVGQTYGRALRESTHYKWLGILISERARDRLEEDRHHLWKENMWPAFAALTAAQRSGFPVSLISDQQLRSGKVNGFKAIFVPDQSGLDRKQREVLEAFEENGGRVIKTASTAEWRDEYEVQDKITQIELQLRGIKARPPAWFKTSKQSNPIMFTHVKPDGNVILAVANDFSWATIDKQKTDGYSREPELEGPVRIVIDSARSYGSATDLFTGQSLPMIHGESGTILTLPPFGYAALVSLGHNVVDLELSD